MKKTVLIEGMMCDHCVAKVRKAFEEKGAKVNVSLEDKKAVLEDTNLQDNEIRQIIDDLSFEVIDIK